MLCPNCHESVPGGEECPRCGQPVPERESFEGQGGHYFYVLAVLSLTLFVVATIVASLRSGRRIAFENLVNLPWFGLYAVLFSLPALVGLYYWWMLRNEEIIVTDDYVERHSRWGDERFYWHEFETFRRRILPFRETRVGWIAGLSRWLVNRRIFQRLPPYAYELIGHDAQGRPKIFRLEPGSVDDMDWLLKVIQARVGPPRDE